MNFKDIEYICTDMARIAVLINNNKELLDSVDKSLLENVIDILDIIESSIKKQKLVNNLLKTKK